MDLSAIKAQLEEAANADYQKTLSEATIDRPSDKDLFRENVATAAVVEEVIRYDAEAEKAREANASGVYHASTPNKSRRSSKVVEAEVVTSSSPSGWGGYYGSRTATTTTSESVLEKQKKKAAEQVERAFEDAMDEALLEDDFDVFSMHAESAKTRALEASYAKSPAAKKKHRQKLKQQASFYKCLLMACKTALKVSKRATIYKEDI